MYSSIFERVELFAYFNLTFRFFIEPLLHSLFTFKHHHILLFLNLLMLWLVLHYSSKVNKMKLELKLEIRAIETNAHDAAQAAIIEQAMLFDREVRKLQDEMRELKRAVGALKTAIVSSSSPECPKQIDNEQDLVEAFVIAKKKGLRRMCVDGRGWVPVKRVQLELNLSDQEVKSLCSV